MANTPDLTTATACSSAVTGVGATPAVGSQPCSGQMALFTPKPKNINRNARSNSLLFSGVAASPRPMTANSREPPWVRMAIMPIKAAVAPAME